jgi:hypothetical protein
VERASQVFGVAEGVIARAARLASSGDRSGQPMAAAVKTERQIGNSVERSLLKGLWHAPELLDAARAELRPEDFSDEGMRSLARAWWEHGVLIQIPEPDGEQAGRVARELAISDEEGLNHHAIVQGAIRKLLLRRLRQEQRQRGAELGVAKGDELLRIKREIHEIALRLKELST